ncbi:hypothetical protein M3196_12975 [Fictibacillus nanhaiensis]|uniref:hypothetical protein n=1 Tax=Fictibacillus nanhaiensis TaxID=742169 RepID=UPI00203AFD33|nr:hypothetical protein [Fictibacillus nanhaiensis]MCM3732578.1 hypothetical protein [Fictibacillus nanhaiensis]
MSTDKVKFKLELQEEKKSLSFVLIVIFVSLILSSILLFFVGRDDQGELDAQGIASQWAEAELQSNVSMKYLLLSEGARINYVDEIPAEKKKPEVTYEFEEYDLYQWKKNKDEYIYKFHYYGIKSCSECQKDVWVRIKAENGKWVIPESHFSEFQADSLIKNLEAEQIPTSVEQEEEMKKKKSIFEKLLNL